MSQETGQFYKYILHNSKKKNPPIWEKSVSRCCLRSNVCIWRSLTRQRVDHNVVSQQHTLLCRWGSFIMVMLFILLIGVAGFSSTRREKHPSLQQVLDQILLSELNLVTNKLKQFKLLVRPDCKRLWLKNFISFYILEVFLSTRSLS